MGKKSGMKAHLIHNQLRYFYRGVFFVMALLLSSCVNVSLLTYPPEFTWIDRDSVKSVMHNMAVDLGEVERLISQSSAVQNDATIQSDVVAKLQDIENLAQSLVAVTNTDTNDERSVPATNHLLIDDHINEFMSQIMRARLMAESDPPNYYGAGQLVGNCNACHRLR